MFNLSVLELIVPRSIMIPWFTVRKVKVDVEIVRLSFSHLLNHSNLVP